MATVYWPRTSSTTPGRAQGAAPELARRWAPSASSARSEIAARLQHPHILPAARLRRDAPTGCLYYVMPYVEGETLRARLSAERQLAVPEALRITGEVADALGHAHAAGVVHRDIKPENILLADGHALVADFGIAKAVSDAAGGEKLTETGLSLGTPAYMEPGAGGRRPRIDAGPTSTPWAVCPTRCSSARSPYAATTPQQQMAAHITQTPAPITSQRPDCPPALAALVMRCLSKNPDERWQSAEEVVTALGAIETMTPHRESWWTRRRIAVLVGTVVLLVAVMLGSAVRPARRVTWHRPTFSPCSRSPCAAVRRSTTSARVSSLCSAPASTAPWGSGASTRTPSSASRRRSGRPSAWSAPAGWRSIFRPGCSWSETCWTCKESSAQCLAVRPHPGENVRSPKRPWMGAGDSSPGRSAGDAPRGGSIH